MLGNVLLSQVGFTTGAWLALETRRIGKYRQRLMEIRSLPTENQAYRLKALDLSDEIDRYASLFFGGIFGGNANAALFYFEERAIYTMALPVIGMTTLFFAILVPCTLFLCSLHCSRIRSQS